MQQRHSLTADSAEGKGGIARPSPHITSITEGGHALKTHNSDQTIVSSQSHSLL